MRARPFTTSLGAVLMGFFAYPGLLWLGASRWELAVAALALGLVCWIEVRSRRATEPQARAALARALAGAESSFHALLLRSPVATCLVQDDRVLLANPALCELLGRQPEELIGLTPMELFHPDEQARRAELLATTCGPKPAEARWCRKDGECVWVELGCVEAELDGAPALVVMGRDRSEQRRLEARLALNERLISMGSLVAGVAHEINNPLAYVAANLRYVNETVAELKANEVAGDVRQALEEASGGAERIAQIVRDLKTASAPEDERLGPVDVEQVLDATLRVVGNQIRQRARLEKRYGGPARVRASSVRLGQVFTNLLVNAVQALPEGNAEHHAIRVWTGTGPEGEVLISVNDTGMGIPEANRARIFDPFFTTKPAGIGTGLGLSICQQIINSMGGEISVESEVGKGTTFVVTLPAATSDEASAKPLSPRSVPPRRRVLIVDDEPLVVRALQRLLGQVHDTEAVGSGREALDRIASGVSYDAVVCDLMMPDMSGMELFERTSSLAPAQAQRFVFLTGGVFTPQAEAFLERLQNPCLHKPIDRDTLLGAIAEPHVDDHRPEASSGACLEARTA